MATLNSTPRFRRQLHKEAKKTLRKTLLSRSKYPRPHIERALRTFLRRKSNRFLWRVARVPAHATLIASCIVSAAAHTEPPIELSDIAAGIGGYVILGAENEQIGDSISAGGDVNGDGLPDQIVSALFADVNELQSAGRTYVVFGKADTNPVELNLVALDDADLPGDSGGFVVNGIGAHDRSGGRIASAGDVNGDGLEDIVIGARTGVTTNSLGSGQAFVVFGKADGAPVNLADIAQDDASIPGDSGGFVINGVGAATRDPYSVSAAGDVNNDGYADVLVGTPWFSEYNDYSNTGRGYVVFGKPDGAPVNLSEVLLNDASIPGDSGGFVIEAEGVFGRLGFNVSGTGDMNGDSFDDVIIGTYYSGAYVVFGKPDGALVDLDDVAEGGDSSGFFISGQNVNAPAAEFGNTVSGANDTNGDGIPDVIVGAPSSRFFTPHYETGDSYVIFGKTDGAPIDAATIALDDSATTGDSGGFIISPVNRDDVGSSVSRAGDVNGDGLDDVITGADRADPNGIYGAGQAHVVFGKPDGAPVEVEPLRKRAGFTLNGEEENDHAGRSVSGAGDINGDGLDDIAIGAPYADPDATEGQIGRGRVYVVFSPLPPPIFVDFAFNGIELGTKTNPFNTVAEALNAAQNQAFINFAPGSTNTPIKISKPVTLKNDNPPQGPVRIGRFPQHHPLTP